MTSTMQEKQGWLCCSYDVSARWPHLKQLQNGAIGQLVLMTYCTMILSTVRAGVTDMLQNCTELYAETSPYLG